MRRILIALLLLMGALTLTPAHAAVSPTSGQILRICPDDPEAKACPGAAEWFLSSRPPSETSDAQIITLAVKLVEDLKANDYPLPVCLDVADGLRVLAKGMLNEQPAEQLAEIAETLCEDSDTAAIGDNGPRIPPTPHSILTDPPRSGGNCRRDQRDNCGPQSCEPGYHRVGGQCVPNDVECDEGEHEVNGVCVPDEEECPVGTHPTEGGGCVPDQDTCGPGEVEDGEGGCEPGTCGPNQTGEYPDCDLIVLQCPEFEHQEGTQCVADEVCPENFEGTPPSCTPMVCDEGYEGEYPDCDLIVLQCPEFQHQEGTKCVRDTSVCINPAGNILPVTSQACVQGQGYKICSLVDANVNSATCPPVGIACGPGGQLSQDGKSCVEEEDEVNYATLCNGGSPGQPYCVRATGNPKCTSGYTDVMVGSGEFRCLPEDD